MPATRAPTCPADGGEADSVALAVPEETAEYPGACLSDPIDLFRPERILIGRRAGLQAGVRFLPPPCGGTRCRTPRGTRPGR